MPKLQMVKLIILRLEICIIILRLHHMSQLAIFFQILEVHMLYFDLRIALDMEFVAVDIDTWIISSWGLDGLFLCRGVLKAGLIRLGLLFLS